MALKTPIMEVGTSMSGRRKIYSEPVHVGWVAKKIMAGLRHRKNDEMGLVLDIWRNAVGEAIAANTLPARIQGDTLWVNVDNSVWIHELQFLKEDILSSVNAMMEGKSFSDIRFKIGRV